MDLENLRARLASVGVNPTSRYLQGQYENVEPQSAHNQQEMENILERIHSVEMNLHAAGHPLDGVDPPPASADMRLLGHSEVTGLPPHAAGITRSRSASPKPSQRKEEGGGRQRKKAVPLRAAQGARPHSAVAAPRSMPRNVVGLDLMRGATPHTPLAAVLQQYKEAEVAWNHDKAQLRREAVEQRRRANKADAELLRATRSSEHRAMDVKTLRSALKHRDAQLEAASEQCREVEIIMARSQEEANARIAAIAAERDDLKALLVATLQRLEAVDEVVHRSDVSNAVLQDKVRMLESERLTALESAARARAEVAELTESRRKLQWQGKLLEKMSEVQLKHNRRKSEAIRKLLAGNHPDAEADAYAALHGDETYDAQGLGAGGDGDGF